MAGWQARGSHTGALIWPRLIYSDSDLPAVSSINHPELEKLSDQRGTAGWIQPEFVCHRSRKGVGQIQIREGQEFSKRGGAYRQETNSVWVHKAHADWSKLNYWQVVYCPNQKDVVVKPMV